MFDYRKIVLVSFTQKKKLLEKKLMSNFNQSQITSTQWQRNCLKSTFLDTTKFDYNQSRY